MRNSELPGLGSFIMTLILVILTLIWLISTIISAERKNFLSESSHQILSMS